MNTSTQVFYIGMALLGIVATVYVATRPRFRWIDVSNIGSLKQGDFVRITQITPEGVLPMAEGPITEMHYPPDNTVIVQDVEYMRWVYFTREALAAPDLRVEMRVYR